MKEAKLKKGRLIEYYTEIGDEICLAIATSSKGVKRLCKENPSWPTKSTIFRWLKSNDHFRDQYARARMLQVEVLIDEILEIADDSSLDTILNEKGHPVSNSESINRARLRIDTRKWLACKLLPKVYGNKIENTHMINITHEEALKMLS